MYFQEQGVSLEGSTVVISKEILNCIVISSILLLVGTYVISV